MIRTTTTLAALLTCSALAGQGPAAAHGTLSKTPLTTKSSPANSKSTAARTRPSPVLEPEELLIPIHSAPDDPVGGPYGVWTAAASFKASFHDGFCFYPFLGPSYSEHLPLAWHTESIHVGSTRVFDANEPMSAHSARRQKRESDWRYEYELRDGIVEAYDVSKAGIEQTFTIARRPTAKGDLVVTGRVTTKLTCSDVSAAHTALRFVDATGKVGVRYGEAFAVDARGDKIRITTRYSKGRIRLTVPSAWLDRAAFPLTIDPLMSPILLGFSTANSATVRTDVAPYAGDGNHLIVVAHSTQFTANDRDCYAQVMNDDFTNRQVIWLDVTTNWSTKEPSATRLNSANWGIAIERAFLNNRSGIRLYKHPIPSQGFMSGSHLYLKLPWAVTHRRPRVTGTIAAPNKALVVFNSDQTWTQADTNNTEVYGSHVDLVSNKFGPLFRVPGPANASRDRQHPTVEATRTSVGSVVVAWQERDNSSATNPWAIHARKVSDYSGPVGNVATLGDPSSSSSRSVPQIAGTGSSHLVAYHRQESAFVSSIRVHRFDWNNTTNPTTISTRTIATSTFLDKVTLQDVATAYGDVGSRLWALAYSKKGNQLWATRLGHTGAVVEQTQALSNLKGGASLCGRWPHSGFGLVAATSQSSFPLYGWRLLHSPDAANIPYGASCSGSISATVPPHAGMGSSVGPRFIGGKAGHAAILYVSANPASIPLPGPGCKMLVDTNALVLTHTTTLLPYGNQGIATHAIPLPDAPLFVGDLYCQWWHLHPADRLAELERHEVAGALIRLHSPLRTETSLRRWRGSLWHKRRPLRQDRGNPPTSSSEARHLR